MCFGQGTDSGKGRGEEIMGNSKISWTEKVWNPVTGCTKCSPGCEHCYAEKMAHRLKAMGTPGYENEFKVTLHPERLDEPLKWRKPSRIFVCSMGDLFHEDVPDNFIADVFATAMLCPQHTFFFLTKRTGRMYAWMEGLRQWQGGDKLNLMQNCWLGVTVCNQQEADEKIPQLLQIPAAVRFVSVEPMLGGINLIDIPGYHFPGCTTHDVLSGRLIHHDDDDYCTQDTKLDWVVCGGESGPGARPMHPDWVRGLRDQCAEAGVPFFFKQWGEWASYKDVPHDKYYSHTHIVGLDKPCMVRVGKKHAGHLLDGKEYRQLPEVKESTHLKTCERCGRDI